MYSAHKKYARMVNAIYNIPKRLKKNKRLPSFLRTWKEFVSHNDVIVIAIRISRTETRRILIDNGSLSYIIFFSTFEQIGINEEKLNKISRSLIGFNGIEAPIIWTISQHITLDEASR